MAARENPAGASPAKVSKAAKVSERKVRNVAELAAEALSMYWRLW
jgi:hypothetical protein